MNEQPRWPLQAVVPIIAGLSWLSAANSGVSAFLVAILPGALLLASGVSLLLWSGDRRIPQFMAMGAGLGVVLSVPVLFLFGFGSFLGLGLLSAASWCVGGYTSVAQEPSVEGVPDAEPSVALSGNVAFDDVILAAMQVFIPMPSGDHWGGIAAEVDEALEFFGDSGWIEKPQNYHLDPPKLLDPRLESASVRGIAYERLSFDSGYEPHENEPGRERWLSYAPNREAQAWVIRNPNPDAPWLMCVHGYQMGFPIMDTGLFRPEWLQEELGFNLVMPTLPLHGRRKIGRLSGDGYLAGETLDTIHAETQAIWDLRRVLSWVRTQSTAPIAVHGVSLGGYTSALLAGFEGDLSCVIPGVPVSDFAGLSELHSSPLLVRSLHEAGLTIDKLRKLYRVVSPLSIAPKVDRERRFIFGGISDRLAPATQVHQLWEHWDQPKLFWYQGGHISFVWDRKVREFIESAFLETGLIR